MSQTMHNYSISTTTVSNYTTAMSPKYSLSTTTETNYTETWSDWATNSSTTTSDPPPPPVKASTGQMSNGELVGFILGAIIVVIGMVVLACRYKRNKRRGPNNEGIMQTVAQPGLQTAFTYIFTYEELSKATENFSEANLLGEGGFGLVYKGILSNDREDREVAVKQIKPESWQGVPEFKAEIETISRIHHRNLVSVVGYCINEAQRLLVYEFLPNNNLYFHLHGKDKPTMNWTTRLKIAIGSAKGLAYLHEDCHPKIIHRDIKAANILLDNGFEAKLADFGLVKYLPETKTHVSTRVVGTFGYMAPEYASSGKLTEKSDVFSFGVVLLELITCRLPVAGTQSDSDDNLVHWARPLLQQALQSDNHDALVDRNLQKDYDSVEMGRMITCAAACVNPSARDRPRMSEIARALEGEKTLDGLYGTSHYNSTQYKVDLANFRKLALGSQELGTNPSSSSTGGRRPKK